MNAQDIASLPLGWDIKNALMRQLAGYSGGTDPGVWTDWMAPSTGAAANENGDLAASSSIDPAALQKLSGYTFDWAPTGKGDGGKLSAFDAKGGSAGTWEQKDPSLLQGLGEWGVLAGAGFGLAGLAGFGPMAGLGASTAAGSGNSGGAAGFNAALDSQLASSQLGITGAQSAAAATVPASVDLGSLGGILSTGSPMSLEALRAGELAGYASNGSLPSSAAVPTGSGGLLGSLPSGVRDAASGAASWLKDNPTLGRLLLGGATSLLSGGSSGESEAPAGPPVQWNSPLQQGLLTPVQQYAPPAQQRPAGLLAKGYANDGAWRYMGG